MRTNASSPAVRFIVHTTTTAVALFLLFSVTTAPVQPSGRHLDVEVEPMAYVLGGAGGHVGYQVGGWTYTVEVFELTVPEALHGNDGFEAAPLGAEFHTEWSFGASPGGFYAGPEVGVSRLKVTHQASGQSETHTRYSVGVRGGYRWYSGLGGLYLSPVVGLVCTLNAQAVDIEGDTFENGPLTPFATVGIGWSF